MGVRLENAYAPNRDLDVTARLPRMERVSFVRVRLTPAIISALSTVAQPFDLIIEEPTAPPDEKAIDALADVAQLRRLELRGALVGEDVVLRMQERRPDVEIVLAPADEAEEPQAERECVVRLDKVQWTW